MINKHNLCNYVIKGYNTRRMLVTQTKEYLCVICCELKSNNREIKYQIKSIKTGDLQSGPTTWSGNISESENMPPTQAI